MSESSDESSATEVTLRICQQCAAELIPGSFYDHRGNLCKKCHNLDMAERKKLKRDRRREEIRAAETFASGTNDTLYVLQNPRIPQEKKVGKSRDPYQRANELSKCQNFKLEILKIYPRQGHLEAIVHKKLSPRRVTEGDGTLTCNPLI